jgi:pimeloyl-ACP methyl ester carboxylesterase
VTNETPVNFRSLDGLRLQGTLARPSGEVLRVAVLVHGGGATRDETGFFTRVAAGLAEAGTASIRFDLRAHGASEGRVEELTLAGVLNDIRAAVEFAGATMGQRDVDLIGTSFSGGLCAYYAARNPDLVRRLVLLNPLLTYKKRFVDDKPYWRSDHLDLAAAEELSTQGYLAHSPTFRLGRALLNEVFHLRPGEAIASLQAATLFVHGTRDTFIPVDSSRQAVALVRSRAKLVEIAGAQHGFAVHEDPQYREPQTQAWQAQVIAEIVQWLCDAE